MTACPLSRGPQLPARKPAEFNAFAACKTRGPPKKPSQTEQCTTLREVAEGPRAPATRAAHWYGREYYPGMPLAKEYSELDDINDVVVFYFTGSHKPSWYA